MPTSKRLYHFHAKGRSSIVSKPFWTNELTRGKEIFIIVSSKIVFSGGGTLMYAIVKTGGKQILLSPGDKVKVEKIEGNVGDEIELSDVLMVKKDDDVIVGKPFVDGASVKCDIVWQGKGKKIIVYTYKRRKGSHKKRGHRQLYTDIQVKEITLPSSKE
jgi:large subunit ribosomal protein L21